MSTCSKLILFGEHSVVYGKKALALPIKYINISVKLEDHEIIENEHVKYIKELIESRYEVPKKYVKINSNIPIGSGLGSSAALGVEIARKYKEINSLVDIKLIADLSEKKVHINPSGIDVSVILNEKSIVFQKEKGIKELNSKLGAYILIVNSMEKSITSEAVRMVREGGKIHEIERLALITEEGIYAYKKKDLKELGRLMSKAQVSLSNLGLSTNKIDKILKTCRYYSYGAKITGAGMGGCVIALIDKKRANKLIKKLSKIGVEMWLVKV